MLIMLINLNMTSSFPTTKNTKEMKKKNNKAKKTNKVVGKRSL